MDIDKDRYIYVNILTRILQVYPYGVSVAGGPISEQLLVGSRTGSILVYYIDVYMRLCV